MSGFVIEYLKEDEHDGPSFTETQKHWHVFEIIGRRTSRSDIGVQ